MSKEVYDQLANDDIRGDRIRIRCDTILEWIDLYNFAQSVGYWFECTSYSEFTKIWSRNGGDIYLVFESHRQLGYGRLGASIRLADTDLYDIIYSPMDFDGDVMSILDC